LLSLKPILRRGALVLLAVALFQNPSLSLSQTSSYPDTTDSRAVSAVVLNYDQDPTFVQHLVSIAEKYAYSDFPKKEDILAIVAVESRFRTNAHYGNSQGLMQIDRVANHKDIRGSLFDPEENIRVGVKILRKYYDLLGGNRRAAIMAYNEGIGLYMHGRRTRTYLTKVEKNAKLIYPAVEQD
jgi:hypothetical protein